MPRRLTRAEARANILFLERLGLSGNAALAAREAGLNVSTLKGRRRRDPVFAQGWAAAVTAAHAKLHLAGGKRAPDLPSRVREGPGEGLSSTSERNRPKRTQGGEPIVVRAARGTLQIRLARPGRLTSEARQAFLRALAATANVRLSAAAAGASHATFYHHKRHDPAFAREWRLALQQGYDRLELGLLARVQPESYADDAWREADPAPTPPLSAAEALQLLTLHQKEARLAHDRPHQRRRRNETDAQYKMRLFLMWRAEQRHVAEDRAVARAARWAEEGTWRLPGEPEPPPKLPPLDQVTGWSRACPEPVEGADPEKAPHHEGVPLFGGWRIGDLRRVGKG